MDLETHVTLHIAQYRKGQATCPRTANLCGVNPKFNDKYIAEWDKQMVVARARMFKRGVK